MGATKWRQLFLIKVPAAAPSMFSGIRLAAVYAPIGATIGEWVGSSQGLGYLMLLASGRVKIDLMFAGLLTLGVMSIGLYAIITVLLSKLSRYHSSGHHLCRRIISQYWEAVHESHGPSAQRPVATGLWQKIPD